MNWWQSIILGLVQGFTEFLPVSSSGHLVLFQTLFGLESESLVLFDLMLHLATLVAVVTAMWPDVWPILRRPFQKLTLLLIVATLPLVALALLGGSKIEEFFGGRYLGLGFMITATLLMITTLFSTLTSRSSNYTDTHESNKLEHQTWLQTLVMGTMQAVGAFPGISRSGSTITGGLLSGVSRENAARFSFLMSIPAILGAFVFKLRDIIDMGIPTAMGGTTWPVVLLGMVFAALSGFVAVKWMLKLIKNGKLWLFSLYLVALGALVMVLQITGRLFLR